MWPPADPADPDPDSHPLQLQSRYQNRLHERVAKHRTIIVDALWEDAADAVLRKRARQMGWCGCRPSIRGSATGPRPSLARCRDRLCPLCSRLRGVQSSIRTESIVTRFNSARFITLTMRHRDEPLGTQVDLLLERIRTLRADKRWKRCVAGGVQAIEITYRRNTQRWHVHAHIIVNGRYFPQPQLKAAWLDATGDSDVVDIRPVHDRAQAARYVARYVGKPLDPETWPTPKLREYAHAMKGRRLLQPFGNAMKMDVDEDDDDSTEPGTTHLCHADQLHKAAERGSQPARRAIEILSRLSAPMAAIMLQPGATSEEPDRPTSEDVAYAVGIATLMGNTPEAVLDAALEAFGKPAASQETHPWPQPPPAHASLFSG